MSSFSQRKATSGGVRPGGSGSAIFVLESTVVAMRVALR
jgi:hypothetical protein